MLNEEKTKTSNENPELRVFFVKYQITFYIKTHS